jgi:hypothetical protein
MNEGEKVSILTSDISIIKLFLPLMVQHDKKAHVSCQVSFGAKFWI